MSYVSGRIFTGRLIAVPIEAATQLHPTQSCREVMIQNDPLSTGNLLVGNINNQFITLTPGQAITLPVISLNLVYIKSVTVECSVNWLARD